MSFEKRLQEIESRKVEIRSMLNGEEKVDLTALKNELEILDKEKNDIEERKNIANSIQTGGIIAKQVTKTDDTKYDASSEEYRTAFFKNLQNKELTDIEKRALSYTTATAGAVIPTQTLNKIIEKLEQSATLFPLVQHYNIAGNLKIGIETDTAECEWTTEASKSTAKQAGIGSIELAAYQLCKFVSVSAQIAKMSIDALEDFIVNSLSRKLYKAIDKAIMDGTGNGQATGITKDMTFTQVSKLDYDAVVDFDVALNSEYSKGAVYVMNKKTRAIVKKIKDKNGNPIFVKDTTGGFNGYLDGYPVVVYDNMDDNKLILGNLNNYIFNFASAPEITPSTEAGFYENAVVWRIVTLADGKPSRQEAFVGYEIDPSALVTAETTEPDNQNGNDNDNG